MQIHVDGVLADVAVTQTSGARISSASVLKVSVNFSPSEMFVHLLLTKSFLENVIYFNEANRLTAAAKEPHQISFFCC